MVHVNKRVLTVLIVVSVVLYAGFFLLKQLFTPSGYSNCVIVRNEIEFVGENLKTNSPTSRRVVVTDKCIMDDKNIDNGNGPRKGKVRWAECYSGPDCNEAGWY